MRQYELVERVRSYDPDADEDLLNRAYVFAMKAHGAQLRASGDPYFHHPVEVAGILTSLRLDSATIATALLHDTVEDTGATLEEIRRLFGATIAKLVDGVTKLNKLEIQSAHTAQAENFRKLLLAMSEDIRVLLVKLADRLHNMRTLHFIKKVEKRRRIAAETMEIYAPLAERIGMDSMKAELEDLAFAELFPDARESIVHRLHQLRRDDTKLIERIVAELHDTLAGAGIEAQISGREKTPISIWRKMERKNISFEQLADIMAFRVEVDSVQNCYAALGVIHGRYQMLPGRFKDFISTPKPNGYRSLHTTIIGPDRRKIEVQIRTAEMHSVAELGVAAHWAYKQNSHVTEGKRYRWIRELLDILEHAAEPEEFLENTKLEMYQDQVFCFSPKGDLIALPRGATPIDFAYAVHSEVGDHCVGAKVDGRMVQLRTQLSNGDQVDIITSKNAAPSAEWERFAVTGKARARIRRHVRTRQRGDFVEQGRDLLQRQARAENVQLSEKQLEKVLEGLHQRSVEDLLAAVGEGTLGPRTVLDTVFPELKRPQPPSDPLRTLPARRGKPEPLIESGETPILGLPAGVAFQYAGCCHPVPGDPIVGVVRTGRAVTIHRAGCANLERLQDEDGRSLDVGWNSRKAAPRAVARLGLMTLNRPGALGNISTLIGKLEGNIVDVRFLRRAHDHLEMLLDVEVADLEQLHRIKAGLRATSVVASVERIAG
ncbi:bifunctional (p)ppGpp synthetase/guanosine-3',5'-bis(diphosphate) 3'-pyrophosphohydrolase [Rhodospirillales bacterium YIM 152171]|uniref:GTP pyrophosphokinase rsh n=2 Tax=Marinimicrococcus flavescens TaxID=3031815 RepID=A0AAP3UYX3_9PROT|nr:bifunctional (p)ppGpp synthetase/guanosine-3',5'-bis(diphosphate) 3'-pyrophosphohydrolase [Marinimicrococcus flavescens]